MNAWTETKTHGERYPGTPGETRIPGAGCRQVRLEPRFARVFRVCLSGTLAAILVVLVAGCDSDPTKPAMAGDVQGNGAGVAPDSPGSAMPDTPEFAMMVASVPELSADDLGGEVTLEQIAERWVRHAELLHARASSLAGPNPQPPISAWLQVAGQLLGQATASLATGNHQAAIAQAQASAHHSHQVIDALQESPEPPDLEDRARAAIQAAEQLLAEARGLAGSVPSERVDAALLRASSLLAEAQAAFGDEDYAAAIRLARQSAGISQAVIRHLTS